MTDRSLHSLREDAGQHGPLPVGTRVRDYVVERVLGNGGFGITYLAHHVTLDRRVAIKEFFPREFAVRTGLTIRPSGADDQVYDWSRRKFLEEARVIARFNHPSIVRVLDVLETNGSAYMVQGFEAGQSLGAWLKARRGVATQKELDDLLGPLLGALEEVHEQGLLHRDIAPDNIIIRRDGRPVLIDFGAARGYLGEQTRTVAVVKPGFSPPEQYTPDARHQGPWTDIYALAATLYLAVTGELPQVAPQRTLDEENVMAPAVEAAVGRFRRSFLEAIDVAMSMRPADRPQSVAEWRDMLRGDAPARPAGQRGGQPTRPQPPRTAGGRSAAEPPRALAAAMPHWPRIAAAVIGVLIMVAAVVWLARGSGGTRTTATECDRLAASPTDARRASPGVEWHDLDGAAAAESCQRVAVAAGDADRPRYQMQLGRALERQRRHEEAARAYRLAANAGHAEAMTRLADLLYGGLGGPRDLVETCRLYEAAAKAGHAEGMAGWAACLERGLGVTRRDRPLAIEWMKRAASRGYVDADVSLAVSFGTDGPGRNAAEAVRLLTDASRRGSWLATYYLAERYETGDGVARDGVRARQLYSEAAGIARRVAAANRGEAHFVLGLMHYNGQGLEADAAASARHFQAAVALGSHFALSWLGALYERGEGVAQSYGEARRLYEAAVERGDSDALVNLAVLHRDGNGAPKDPTQARALLERAVGFDVTAAVHEIAYLHEEGIGTPQNYAEALRLYRQAADRGHHASLNSIGQMHENGRGTRRNVAEALRWYTRGAEKSDAGSLDSLGLLHLEGTGVEKSERQALALFRRAAERGNAASMTRVGSAFREGQGVEKDYATAIAWFRRAAARGDASAMTSIGFMHEFGQGVAENAAEAATWYRRAMDRGDANGTDLLGTLFQDGKGVTKNEAEAVRLFRIAAGKGQANAMTRLGHAYREGRGVPKELATALQWYRAAAVKDEPYALHHLGLMLEAGEGVTADATEAARHYRLAADKGNAEAMLALAALHQRGSGVVQDQAAAFRLIEAAARTGDGRAMMTLGIAYHRAEGTAKDLPAARRWFEAAVAKDNAAAHMWLGFMHERGEAGPVDLAEALRLYRRGADLGHAGAMFFLAGMLENGRGVARSCAEATALYRRSAAGGDDDARKKLADGSLARCR